MDPLRMYSTVGRRLPAYTTALGPAMLAELPDDVRDPARYLIVTLWSELPERKPHRTRCRSQSERRSEPTMRASADDLTFGGSGNDTVYGNDAVHGGPVNDKLHGGPDAVRIS
jgi:hypothetical protein